MSRAAARRAAALEFGSVAAVKDDVRDVGWESLVGVLACDVRSAWRTLVTSPGFTLVAATTMALGIGATTATFSVVEAVLLRPLPYPEPERLVWAWGQRVGGAQRSSVNPQEYLDYRKQGRNHRGNRVAGRPWARNPRPPSPKCLHDAGRFASTGEHSRRKLRSR